ncbi:MAG: hypothetical protein ACM3ZT_03810 [Bacillota bacterium]
MKRLVWLIFILAFAACSKAPDVTVQGAAPNANVQAIVDDATKMLNTACTGLNQYVYDLVKKSWSASVSNNAGNSFNYHTERWGWTKWVTLSVQVSPKAKDLPKEWDAPGKILTYDIGGGKYPGIATRDKLSQLMCRSMSVSNSVEDPDSHLDWPDASEIDKLP